MLLSGLQCEGIGLLIVDTIHFVDLDFDSDRGTVQG